VLLEAHRLHGSLATDDAGLVGECADLIYHLIVLLRARELDWSDVRSELARRARA
jgi:phosphoribosyl-ATP pyrophosphohydrolase